MKLGIRGKLFAISLTLIASVGLAAGLYLEGELRGGIERRIEDELGRQVATAAEMMRFAGDTRTTATLDPLADRLGQAMQSRVTIIAGDGRVLGDSDIPGSQVAAMSNHGTRPEVIAARTHGRGQSHRYSTTLHTDLLYLAMRVPTRQELVVRVSRPLAAVDRAVTRLRILLLLAGALGLGVAILMSAATSHYMTRTLRQLADSARTLARTSSDETGAHLEVLSADELGRLAGSFNRMAESIEATVQTLALERGRFEAVLQGMSEAVIALDGERHITLMNAAALELLQLSEPPIGAPFIDYLRIPAVHELLRQPDGDRDSNREFTLPGEPTRHVLAHVSPQRLDQGVVIVMHDVTDIRKLKTVRRDFVANVSHELRTPVSVIRANAETLLAGAMNDPRHGHRLLDALHRNAERLAAIITELLALSRLEAGEYHTTRAPVALLELASRACDAVAESAADKQIALACDIPAELTLDTDDQALERILVNYLDNAIKYTPSGGHVRISATPGDADVRIAVEDDGPGIAPQHQSRVFERFYRIDPGRSRSMGGTGLGLSIVKNLADALGADVGMEPIAPHGSRFYVAFPRAAQPPRG